MHAPGHLREAFCELVEGAESVADTFYDDGTRTRLEAMSADEQLWWLSGKLWNCTDFLPGHIRSQLQDEQRWDEEPGTYAQAAQRLRAELEA
jgi:hypothetical protein